MKKVSKIAIILFLLFTTIFITNIFANVYNEYLVITTISLENSRGWTYTNVVNEIKDLFRNKKFDISNVVYVLDESPSLFISWNKYIDFKNKHINELTDEEFSSKIKNNLKNQRGFYLRKDKPKTKYVPNIPGSNSTFLKYLHDEGVSLKSSFFILRIAMNVIDSELLMNL